MWISYDYGKTVGEIGSENGTILMDEEYNGFCRITLEKNGYIAPFSITCGIYGLMLYTTFSKNIVDAKEKYEKMKYELQNFEAFDDVEQSAEWCEQFTSRW